MTGVGAEGWNVEGANGDRTVCGGVSMLGGDGLFGRGAKVTRSFKLKDPHYRLKI